MEVPGHLMFKKGGGGNFHFGVIDFSCFYITHIMEKGISAVLSPLDALTR